MAGSRTCRRHARGMARRSRRRWHWHNRFGSDQRAWIVELGRGLGLGPAIRSHAQRRARSEDHCHDGETRHSSVRRLLIDQSAPRESRQSQGNLSSRFFSVGPDRQHWPSPRTRHQPRLLPARPRKTVEKQALSRAGRSIRPNSEGGLVPACRCNHSFSRTPAGA
jgi:hypothetical protein